MNTNHIISPALYLTFKLGRETYAIDVSQVREILDMPAITKVPHAPDFMRGIINIRGSVVPVVDLRLKFGMSVADCTVNTRIIVMELSLNGEITVLGAIADAVNDVVELAPDQIKDPPKIGSRWRTELISGIGQCNEQFIIILDVDRLFSTDELAIVNTTEEGEPQQAAA